MTRLEKDTEASEGYDERITFTVPHLVALHPGITVKYRWVDGQFEQVFEYHEEDDE